VSKVPQRLAKYDAVTMAGLKWLGTMSPIVAILAVISGSILTRLVSAK
jgi:hypothetical protein